LATRTYAQMDRDEQDRLAQDQFIGGLRDEELQELLYREEFGTLEEAMSRALRVEAATRMSRTKQKKRSTAVRRMMDDPSEDEEVDPVRWTQVMDKGPVKKLEPRPDALAEQMKLMTETLVGLKKQIEEMTQPKMQGGFIPKKLFDPYKGERRSYANSGSGPPGGGCFNCGASDHWARQCPKKVAETTTQNHLN